MNMPSEQVIVQAPMSYTGATLRLWRLRPPVSITARVWHRYHPATVSADRWVSVRAWIGDAMRHRELLAQVERRER